MAKPSSYLEPGDTVRVVDPGALGSDVLAYRWRVVTADRRESATPQEFAGAARQGDVVYFGSRGGRFFAVDAATGRERWARYVGPIGATPVVVGDSIFVGTFDGLMLCLSSETGEERWRYASNGVIAETAVFVDGALFFTNEANQVYALDAAKGTYKWQYRADEDEEHTVRGHAGIALYRDVLVTGFSNGTLAALRRENGSLAWSTSLRAGESAYVDVDSTPVIIGNLVVAASVSGGLFALDVDSGAIGWHREVWDARLPTGGGASRVTADGERIYVSAGNLGVFAFDLAGNALWRQGMFGGGEPGTLRVWGDMLFATYASAGVFAFVRQTGELLEYFNPGDGVSVATDVVDSALYALSNRGVMYAFDVQSPWRRVE